MKILLNAAKCQGYGFYGFWVIKKQPAGEGGVKNPGMITNTKKQRQSKTSENKNAKRNTKELQEFLGKKIKNA